MKSSVVAHLMMILFFTGSTSVLAGNFTRQMRLKRSAISSHPPILKQPPKRVDSLLQSKSNDAIKTKDALRLINIQSL